jgi:hypothetical protein
MWTIIISLLASIIGGIISGLFVMRKITHENKRLYARQINEDFDLMSTLLVAFATSYLKSLGYDTKGMESYTHGTNVKENQVSVNRIRKEFERDDKKKLYRYNVQDVVIACEEFVKEILHSNTGLKNFFNKYSLQASHFDGLYKASSAVESLLFWQDDMQRRNDIGYKHICIYDITIYLLDIIDEILKVSSDIAYYCNTKPWTWRLLVPIIRK